MANVAWRSFNSGEVGPAMYARTDTARYQQALRTLRNGVVMRTGGVQSRAGTKYLGTTKGNAAARLVPAVFDTDASYILEFGNQYIRFWENGAQVTVSGVTAWVTATAYTAGVTKSNGGTNYVCIVSHTSGASTEPGVGASWQTRWYALTGSIYEWPTTYTAAELRDLQFAYQLNVVTIVHPAHPPATLTRTSDAVWTLADIVFTSPVASPTNLTASVSGTGGMTYGVTAVYADGSESGLSNTDETNNSAFSFTNCTLTWTAASGAVSYNVYRAATALYTPFQLLGSSTTTTFIDTAPFGGSLTTPPDDTNLFSSAGEYPSVVGAYQQRLLFGGSTDEPDIVYTSKVSLPYDFRESSPLLDSDSLSWRQVGRRLNRIRHFAEVAQRLIQFSDVGESVIQGDTDGVLRPGEVNPRQFSENGAATYPSPLVLNDSALYVQARGSMVRDLAPIQNDQLGGSDLTLTAAHLVDGYQLVEWAYQQTPHSVVWAVRDDGTMLGLTYVRELGIVAWSRHDTDGEFESVACVPEGAEDAVYVVVKRFGGFDSLAVTGVNARYADVTADPFSDTIAAIGALSAGGVTIASTTDNGVTWSNASITGSTSTNQWNYIRYCYGVGEWIAISTNPNAPTPQTISVAVASDPSSTWTTAQLDSGDSEWDAIADIEHLGLAIAYATSGTLASEYDGIAWTDTACTGAANIRGKPVLDATALRLIAVTASNVIYADDPDYYTFTAFTDPLTINATLAGPWQHPTTGRIFIGTSTGLIYTDDVGATWTGMTLSGGVDLMTFTDDGRIYATRTSTNDPLLRYSDDNGATWTIVGIADANGVTALIALDGEERVVLFRNAFSASNQTITYPEPTRFVERFANRLDTNPVLMDSAKTVTVTSNVASGLSHLDGRTVSVTQDGKVLASANNPSYTAVTVIGGQVTLPTAVDGSVNVGIPYTVDIQTLDIDSASRTVKERGMQVGGVIAWVEETGPFYAGPKVPTGNTLTGLEQYVPTNDEGYAVAAGQTVTQPAEVTLQATYNNTGRVLIRQVDPVPLTVLSIAPTGFLNGGR